MPDYLFNLESLPVGEYKATISILDDGRKEIAVVVKTHPDYKIPPIQVPFVISHCPLVELPEHGDLIDRDAILHEDVLHYVDTLNSSFGSSYVKFSDLVRYAPVIVPSNKEDAE